MNKFYVSSTNLKFIFLMKNFREVKIDLEKHM